MYAVSDQNVVQIGPTAMIGRASMLRNEPFTGSSQSKRATRRRPGKLWPRGRWTLNKERSLYQGRMGSIGPADQI